MNIDLLCRRASTRVILFAFAVSHLAAQTTGTTSDGITYSDNNGAVTITGYTGSAAKLTIPSTIGGDPVTTIGAYSFEAGYLVGITLPGSVTSIGDYAFDGSKVLTDVNFPVSLKSIGSYAFGYTNLTSVVIPSSVTSIGAYAFFDCGSLKSVTFPSSVTSMGVGIFFECYSLSDVQLASDLQSLGEGMFENCTGLYIITLPSNLSAIPNEAFSSSGLIAITIPASVTSIGNNAFFECNSLVLTKFLGNCPAFVDSAFLIRNRAAVIYYPANATGWQGGFVDGTPTIPTSNPLDSTAARLVNISTRARVGTGANVLIPGFVIQGSGTEILLIRAVGPSLSAFGVSGALSQASLEVVDSAGAVRAADNAWSFNSDPNEISSISASVGAFALAPFSNDSAVIVTLPAGAYTVQVSNMFGESGVALAEIYEVAFSDTRLINISTRAQVGTGSDIVIPGFVISGSGNEQLLVRADGPSLASFGVTGVLSQPSLTVTAQADGSTIGSNTGWGSNADPNHIESIEASVGAFLLPLGSADCAMAINLQPGAYTMQISGENNSTGVALAEVYEVQ
jgi:hypothetical protein